MSKCHFAWSVFLIRWLGRKVTYAEVDLQLYTFFNVLLTNLTKAVWENDDAKVIKATSLSEIVSLLVKVLSVFSLLPLTC
jgi:hypothetical protein